MKIKILMENTKGKKECFIEHGFSIYIETDKHKILVDFGASEKILYNAEKLEVDLKEVDLGVLSHGHYDHAGGILKFYEINKNAVILMNYLVGEEYCHVYYDESGKIISDRYIGIDKRIMDLPTVKFIKNDCKIDEEIFIFSNVTGRKLWPKNNSELKFKKNNIFYQDEFQHEQYLVISENDKDILVSGCAHNGILNIIEKYKEIFKKEPDYVISGFHMQKKSDYEEEDIKIIENTAKELIKYKTKYYTGHCTGEIPFKVMKNIMGNQLEYIHSGDTFELK